MPAGYVSDCASIPKLAWSVIGDPWGGDYRNAAVIHDFACDKKDRPWEAVHLTFYYAMLAAGVSEYKAKVMYAAVYHFGPRWGMRVQERLAYVTPDHARQLLASDMVVPQDRARVASAIATAESINRHGGTDDRASSASAGAATSTSSATSGPTTIEVMITERTYEEEPAISMNPDQLKSIVDAVKKLNGTRSNDRSKINYLQSMNIRPSVQ